MSAFVCTRRRLAALVTAASLAALGLVVLLPTPATAAPGPAITAAKSAPATVLAGQPIAYTLSAGNPSSNAGAQPEYNTTFRDVLPIGLTYTAGSTTPAGAGDPTIYTNAGTGQQTLVWSDVDDLQIDSTAGLSFTGTVDTTALPVASVVLNTATAYASTDPRTIPAFDSSGAPIANASVQSVNSNQTNTTITALKITKDEPSTEAKLLRGVHDHPTVYTLTVTNTARAATNGVTVTDYLPAEEEFLGCGQTDNSAAVEYPGAPRLTATPAVGANCPTPISVDTVANPPADGTVAYPAGIYTKVVWNVGTLAAGQTVTIKYAAGIPLQANALFAVGPSPASLGQTANLDNNTGAATRQIGGAAAQVNYAHAAGSYTGPVAGGGSSSVFDDTTHQVTVNDLRIHKTVSPTTFVSGALATYTLRVDSGEYTDNSAITITDVLPNGVCPLDDVRNYTAGAPAECNPDASFAPSLPYQSVTQNADGTFTVVFQPIAVPQDGTTVITYYGRNRPSYTGGALAGQPIAAGDSFTNNATEVGTSTPVAATGVTGNQSVTDGTHATQTTDLGALAKTVSARATPLNCGSATYGKTDPVYSKGDRVCFEITASFSGQNETRNAVLTDFLPLNTTFEAGSVSYPASNTVDPSYITFDNSNAGNGIISWNVGAPNGSSTHVPIGTTFVARFSAVVKEAAAGPAPDKPGNLIKLRTVNSDGVASSLRDLANFQIAAAPPLGITKGVAGLNGSTPDNPANTDHVKVKEGDAVKFRVDVKNNGTAADSNDLPVTSTTAWDALPTGITCAMVSAISDSGSCTNPGDAGQPSFAGNNTRSALVWNYGTALAAGASHEFTYVVTIPATGVSVSSIYSNTSAVRSYTIDNDTPGTTTFYPAGNIDTSVPPSAYDAPAASDNADVFVGNVAVTKGVVSAVNETGNVGAEASPAASTQATIGEQVTFTTSATVPAHTTVYDATFSDPLPAGLTLNGATASYQPDAGSTSTAALPGGVTFSASAPPTLSFPTSYDNTTATDQVFTMTITATVAAIGGNANSVALTNTATFASQTAATGGTAIPSRTAAATVNIVEPAATLSKTNNSGGPVAGGQTITYTLTPGNSAGRSALHNAWQLDCLPNGLTFAAYGAPPALVTTSAPVAGNGTNGCAAGNTVLAWNLGDLAGGQTLTLTYTATVDPGSAGKSSFVNVASVSGNSLAQARTSPVDPGNPAGRQYGSSASSTVNIAGATATKSVTPTTATIGDTVTYTTSAVLPPGVNFYNLALIDQLPNGIDPASVTQTAVACTNADTTACSLTSATALTPVAGPSSSTIIGWLVGDAAQSSQQRTVKVTYTAKVKDNAAAVAGASLTNTLKIAWNTTAGAAPTSAGASFNQTSTTVANATVTVLEPSLAVAKSVSNSTPQPGQSFNYTVAVNNANTTSTSAAYNLTVTDTVPTGVLVDPASISGAGTISGQTGAGGGTISWVLTGPIAKNTGTTFTYSATLAPSSGLTAAGLTNSAKVAGYDSLPSGGRHYTGGTSTATVTPKFPRVSTAKTMPSGSTAYLGESFPWKLTVTDSGSGVAYQVGAVDTLPTNWTYEAGSAQVSVNGGPATQVEPNISTAGNVQTLTWSGLGTLPAGTNLTINYTATPQPGVAGAPGVGLSVNQTNSATANAQDATGVTGNSSGQYTAGPGSASAHIASADVTLSKTVGTAPVAGQTGSFVLTVHNSGPDPATGPFTVTDQFNNPVPSGVSAVSASGTGWSCSTAAPVVCQRTVAGDTLASGASFPTITVSYNLDANVVAGTTLPNTATVVAHSFDPNNANNTASVTATTTAAADLRITKTLSSGTFQAGQPVSYSLAVGNLGPSAAAGPIVVNDNLPAGTTFVSATGSGWTCDPITAGTVAAQLHCVQPGPLAVGATPSAIIVTVGLPSGQTTAVLNTGTVGSATADPVPANNSSSVTNTPTTQADLQIQKRHLTTTFVAGQTADYEIDVYNGGSSDAAAVTVHDALPTGLSYDSFASTDPNWSCAAAGANVTCGYTGSFPAGQTSKFTLTVRLASNFTGSATNTATVTSTTSDPVPGNNSDTDNSSTSAIADLSIAKTDSGPATAGENQTFHLAVHNAGPSDVPAPITVDDSLPAGLTFVSANGSGWSCDYATATRLISCTSSGGVVNGADAAAIDLVVTVNSDVAPSTITNTADVSSGTTDSDLSNNSASDAVSISTTAALSLTKTLTSAVPVLAGTDAVFQLTASNAGPSDAVDVTVTDTLPDYLSLHSYQGSGWTCTASGQDVICSRAGIAANTTAPAITISALVSASIPVVLPAGTTTVTNQAAITSATSGPDTNPAPVTVPVQAQANLSLVKTPKTGTAGAGASYTWHLAVHNDGPSDAAAPLTVTDTLPGYETFQSAAGTGWDCVAATPPTDPSDPQAVTCTLNAALPAGADASALDLQVLVDASAPAGPETNTATVDSATPGADGNDSATVTVQRTAVLSITKSHVGHGVIGSDLPFAITVHNAGPAIADQIVVTDPLPTGFSYVSGGGTGWGCTEAAGTVTCTLAGTLAVGADASALSITATVGAAAYPTATNQAMVASTDPDLPGSSTASDPIVVDPVAALQLSKQHVGSFTVGSDASYRLTVHNTGLTETPGPVVITDPLPSGLSFAGATGTDWTCAATGATVTCTRPGPLGVGTASTVVLRVHVAAAAFPSVANTATVTGPGSPSNSGADTVAVNPLAVLSISKTLLTYNGGVASYSIAVTNHGPNPTNAAITVTDRLPAGLTLLSVRSASAEWHCDGTVSCVRTSAMPAGETDRLLVVARVSASSGTRITNVASLTGGSTGSTTHASQVSSAVLDVSATASGSGALAQTGQNATAPLWAGFGVLLAGLALVLIGRRRRA